MQQLILSSLLVAAGSGVSGKVMMERSVMVLRQVGKPEAEIQALNPRELIDTARVEAKKLGIELLPVIQ